MSLIFDLRCRRCDDFAELNINHGDKELLALLKLRPHFEALAPVFMDGSEFVFMGVDVPNRHSMAGSFFAKHAGHDVVVVDEYGRESGACGERFSCPCCARHSFCALDRGHAGDHARRRES